MDDNELMLTFSLDVCISLSAVLIMNIYIFSFLQIFISNGYCISCSVPSCLYKGLVAWFKVLVLEVVFLLLKS